MAKRRDTERGTPQVLGAQCAAGDEWRNNSRNNEEMEPKQKEHPVVDVTGDEVKYSAVTNNIAYGPGMLGP